MNRRLALALAVALLLLGVAVLLRMGQSTAANPAHTAAVESDSRAAPVDATLAVDEARGSARTPSATALPARAEDAQSDVETPDAGSDLVIRVVKKTDRTPIARVRGYLRRVDPDDSGAKYVDRSHGTIHECPVTADDGALTFTAPSGVKLVLALTADDASAGPKEIEVPALVAGEHREITAELETGENGRFIVKVIDADARTPIAGAVVRVVQRSARGLSRPGGPEDERVSASATTGADGLFELAFSTWHAPFLRIEAPERGTVLVSPSPQHDTSDHACVVALRRAAVIEGSVLDGSGVPLADATVHLTAPGYDFAPRTDESSAVFDGGSLGLPEQDLAARTDAAGRCRIAALPADVNFTVEIRQGARVVRREPNSLMLSAGETRTCEWRIGSGCALCGVMLDQEGKPVGSRAVWLAKPQHEGMSYFSTTDDDDVAARAKTDSEGRFQFADLASGSWWLVPAPTRDYWSAADPAALAPCATLVEIGTNATQDVVLHVFRGIYARGRVLDPNGAPVKDCFVNVVVPNGFVFVVAKSEADGTFALGPIAPMDCSLVAESSGNCAASEPVHVASFATPVLLHLRAGGTLRGKVVDAASGAGCSAQLVLTPETPRSGPFGQGILWDTHDDGVFERQGLEPGQYGLVAETADGRFGVAAGLGVGASAEGPETVIALRPGGKLTARYTGSKPQVFLSIKSSGVPIQFQDACVPGKPFVRNVPAGDLLVEVRSEWDGSPRRRAIGLDAGGQVEIVLNDE